MSSHIGRSPRENDYIEEEIVLSARQGVKIPLGMYEDKLEPPQFDVKIVPTPKAGEIKQSIIRSNDKGDYYLIYYFQNFSDQEFVVTVRERTE